MLRLLFYIISPMYRALSKMPKVCKVKDPRCIKRIVQILFIHEVLHKNSSFSKDNNGSLDDRLKYLYAFFDEKDPIFRAFKARIKLKAVLNYKRKEKTEHYDGQIKENREYIEDNPQAIVEKSFSTRLANEPFWWI